jgi:hypothetical protein
MAGPKMARHVPYTEVGDDWREHGIDAGHVPDRLLSWIEKNLSGRWSYRMMSADEVRAITGHDPEGRFFMPIAFEDEADGQMLKLRLLDSEGSA